MAFGAKKKKGRSLGFAFLSKGNYPLRIVNLVKFYFLEL